MSIDFNDLLEKAGEELNKTNNDITIKSFTNAQGGQTVKRDFSEFAALDTFARNQAASAERTDHGMVSRFERDFT